MSESAQPVRPPGSWTGYPDPSKTNLLSEQQARGSSKNFPGVGTSVALDVENLSAQPSRGTTQRSKNHAKGGAIEAATASHKANIAERLGAKCAPQVPMLRAVDEASSLTQRNVTIVPSKAGIGDVAQMRRG